ncbi:MAG: phosphate regulon sensor histidine kinase PhoR [Rhodocyclales bacterium]|nr:phosphate regulon sensor histidine kinase PhoR [Rhodocyclales bacterium]
MPSVWVSLLIRLVAVALGGLIVGALFGAVAGVSAACGVLLLMLAVHTAHLARLQRWLKAPEQRDIPDAWGAWGNIFVELHRMLRRERKARARIESDLEVYSQAAEASPDGLVFLDAADHIVWCNRVAEQHLGLRGERDAGLLVSNLIRLPGFAEFVASASQGESLMFRPPDGKGRVLSIEAIRFGKDRKLLISFDVTQIERAKTVRSDFVANVSHELRTPLTVISGFIEHMVAESAPDPGEMKQQLAIMDEQAGRMLNLVDDLLTLSRLEDEAQAPREEEFDVRDLIYDVSAEGRRLSAGRHSITCEVVPTFLKGSREELRSAFSNLVSNAVRYTPEGGRILLHWEMRDGKGVFSVEDSGIGIPEEHIPRLTERFYRVDRGRSRESGGTGLGLAIIKHILLRHQAALEIASIPGVGSTFSAVFPAWRVTLPQG